MKLDAIGIVAKNVTKSIQFYRLLGLNFPELKEGEDHVEAQTESGIRLMIDSEELVKKLNSNWVSPVGQRTTLAFLCASPQEVDSTYKKIIESGHKGHKEPWDAFWGQRYASVMDPDGNSVDLFAPL